MSVSVLLSGDNNLSSEQFDAFARDCKNDIASLQGITLTTEVTLSTSCGHRGDPITVGTFALALVTSGTVSALFAIFKSYIERGIEGTFEGVDRSGKPVRMSLKGTSLNEFKKFLSETHVVDDGP
jgi:hypothetical protein